MSRSIRFLLQNDRKLAAAAFMLHTGRPLSLDQETYILAQGFNLKRFINRFSN